MQIMEITGKIFFIIMGNPASIEGKGKVRKRAIMLLCGYDSLAAFGNRGQAEEFMVKAVGDRDFVVLAKDTKGIIEFMMDSGIEKLCLDPEVEKLGSEELSLDSLLYCFKASRQKNALG